MQTLEQGYDSELINYAENPFRSAFYGSPWLVGVLVWCGLAISLVTTNFILQAIR
jgi:hypothetical protein